LLEFVAVVAPNKGVVGLDGEVLKVRTFPAAEPLRV
jgi:hypothetical protein